MERETTNFVGVYSPAPLGYFDRALCMTAILSLLSSASVATFVCLDTSLQQQALYKTCGHPNIFYDQIVVLYRNRKSTADSPEASAKFGINRPLANVSRGAEFPLQILEQRTMTPAHFDPGRARSPRLPNPGIPSHVIGIAELSGRKLDSIDSMGKMNLEKLRET